MMKNLVAVLSLLMGVSMRASAAFGNADSSSAPAKATSTRASSPHRVRFDWQDGERKFVAHGDGLAIAGDTLVLERLIRSRADTPSWTDTVQSARVRVADMSRVEVWSGKHGGHGARGALIGSVVGGVLGLIALQAAQSDPFAASSIEGAEPAIFAGGAALGALIGTGVGALFRSEKWERVDHVRLKQLVESNTAAGTGH